MKPTLSSHLELITWRSLFSLLAWQRATPALGELEVGHLDLEKLRLNAQSFMVEYRSLYRADGTAETELLDGAQALLDKTLEVIESELGAPAIARLLTLAASINYSVEGPAYYQWVTHQLSYWHDLPSIDPRPLLPEQSLIVIVQSVDEWRAEDSLRMV